MLSRPLIMMGAIEMAINPGDILDLCESPLYSLTVAGAVAMIGKDAIQGDVNINGGAAHTVTLPTADSLVKAVAGSMNKISPPDNALYGTLANQSVQLQWPANVMPLNPGASFRRMFQNNNSGTTTFAAPATSGVTISGTATIATVLWIEFLIRILASAPTVIIPVTTTNTTLTLTNVDQNLINNVVPGMSVYGTGIGAAAVVTAVNYDTRTISVSVASTATADNIAVTFTPTVIWQRLRSGTV